MPSSITHISRDPLDPDFDEAATVRAIRHKDSEVKRVLLDQSVVSGIGNIYADEALWRSSINGRRQGSALTSAQVRTVVSNAREVMLEALAQGGTSFDSL